MSPVAVTMPGPVVAGCVMPKSTLHTHSDFGPALARIGLDSAEAFFQSPLVKAWRDVGERDNATLDLPAAAIVPEGLPTRLHVKRYRGGGVAGGGAELRPRWRRSRSWTVRVFRP